MHKLRLRKCGLTGKLALMPEFGLLTGLSVVDLRQNFFSGPFPSRNLARLFNLWRLNLGGNQLTVRGGSKAVARSALQ